MKRLFLSTIIVWSAVLSASVAQIAAQLQSQMSSPSSQVRASALEQFIEHIDLTSQPQQISEALPIFVGGLSDSNSKVRELAAAGLLMVANATMRLELPANPNLPDLATDPKVKRALLSAMSDSDSNVRVAAMQAYAVTYKLTPELEQKIIDAFNSYKSGPGQPDNRFELLGSLVNDRSPSPVAVKFIVQKIDDPQFGITALQSLGSLKKPPTDMLPKLLGEAGQHGISEDRKSALKQAAKAYGPTAQARMDEKLSSPR